MSPPQGGLQIALKEWDVVCRLLLQGRQVVLVRKGGIHEPRRGFAIEHERFFLYPNVEHQNPQQLQPAYHPVLADAPPPPDERGTVVLPGFCRVVDVLPAAGAPRLHALQQHSCWTADFFDARLRYKPERPLFLVTVRCYRLPRPLELPYHKLYAGCRSWVPLRETVPESALDEAEPALGDAAFEAQRQAVLKAGLRTER
jgi:hypothetical protein